MAQWNGYFAGKLDLYPGGLPLSLGGTGATNSTDALRNIVGSPSSVGFYLRSNGSAWLSSSIQAADVPTLNQNTTGTAGGLAGGAIGSLPYQSGTGATSFLSGNTTTTPKFLMSTGTGSAAQAPTLSSSTGSGSVVLSTSAALTSPTLTAHRFAESAITTAASPYTVLTTDTVITCDATSGAVTINLPAATGSGRAISIKKIDASSNACSPTRAGSDTIDGATSYSLTTQYAASSLVDTLSGTWSRMHVNQLGGVLSGISTAAAFSGGTQGSGAVVLATSPTLTTPNVGAATATSINKVAITAPATGSTLTIADGKTLTVSNSIALAGTDGTTMTFPSSSSTVAGLGISQTFTGTQTFNGTIAGTALSTYLASPPAIGGTAPAAVTGTTVKATTGLSSTNLLVSATAPTISSCGTGSPTVTAPNGTAGFRFVAGSASPTSCTLTMPTATTGWNCVATNFTTPTTTNVIKQTGGTASTVIFSNYSSAGVLTAFSSSDTNIAICMAY